MTNPIIIIGTGLAGYQLAREFRRIDQTTPLMLITADEGRFYSKPLLSTALTSGKTSDSLTTATAESMASQLNAIVRTKALVTRIDSETKNVWLDNESFPYS